MAAGLAAMARGMKAAPPVQVAAMGAGFARFKYAGVVLSHDTAARADAALAGVEIRLNTYDPKTGLPPRELIERVAAAASRQGAERLILNGRACYGEFGGNALEMEEMMLRTNAELVGVALDAADVYHARADMVNFFARHQHRIDCIFVREWDSVPYAPLAAEIARRQWQGWLVQSPAGAEERKLLAKLFRV
jgi:hypothetical protein